jgi:hypothetical protein
MNQRIALLSVAFMCLTSAANAALILTIQDATISAGGPGYVNVFIRSSNGTDRLTFASYDFNITGTPGTTLEFTTQDYSEQGFGNYVFAGENAGISEFDLNNSRFIADDAQDGSGLGYRLLPGTDLLLARLDLQHVIGPGQTAASSVGHQFQISLDIANGYTLFQDDNLPTPNDLAIDEINSKLVGTVSVTASAVPEPSSFLLLAVAGGVFASRKRRSKSRALLEPLPA